MSMATAEPGTIVGSGVQAPGVEPALEPEESETEGGSAFTFNITDNKGFERRLDLAGTVSSRSKVFVSAAETGVFGGQLKPFMGLASIEVHNVVPHDDGIVIVRGYIGWESNINVRLSVLVA